MKPLNVSLAALMVAGMTAIPATAQTTLDTDSAYAAPDRTVVSVMEQRYYSADGSTYAVLDDDTSMWIVYDAENDSFIEAYAEADYTPNEAGLKEVQFNRVDNFAAYDEPDRDVAEELKLEKRYYTEDRSTYGIFDPVKSVWNIFDATTDAFVEALPDAEYEPYEPGYAEVRFNRNDNTLAYGEPDRDVAEELAEGQRYFSEDGQVYVVRDPAQSVWMIYNADSDELIETRAMADYDPFDDGYQQVAFVKNDEAMAQDEPDRTGFQAEPDAVLRAGIAEERYYDADRATYGVWDAEQSMWVVYDADSDEILRTVPDAEYTRYEPGYTVIVPGETQVGMGTTGESIADDTQGISDNRQ